MADLKFKNPSNGYVESSSAPWLWTLLFCTLYFLVKGIWTHAIISLILVVVTAGISWLIYPFFARGIVEKSYLKKGWIKVE